jgi:hypothetical protein
MTKLNSADFIRLGSNLASAVYLGNQKVWPALSVTSTVSPAIAATTWTHAIPAGSNLLAVTVSGAASGSPTITSITANGVALTRAAFFTTQPSTGISRFGDIWTLASPPSGQVTITMAGQANAICTSITIAGSISGTSTVGTSVEAGSSLSVTTTSNGLLLLVGAARVAGTITFTSGITTIRNDNNSNQAGAHGYRTVRGTMTSGITYPGGDRAALAGLLLLS